VLLPISCCILRMYVEFTSFQAAMYFSMHCFMHVCSPLDRELPGLGTHRSKHFSLMFWQGVSTLLQGAGKVSVTTYLNQGPRIGRVGRLERLPDDGLLYCVRVHGWGFATWVWGSVLSARGGEACICCLTLGEKVPSCGACIFEVRLVEESGGGCVCGASSPTEDRGSS
jgi:hypothetical protein